MCLSQEFTAILDQLLTKWAGFNVEYGNTTTACFKKSTTRVEQHLLTSKKKFRSP